MQPKDRLIFALDVPDLDKAVHLVKLLDGSVGCFKIGLELFVREGPAALRAIKDHSSADIFLDLKLHDIPATVRGALRSAAGLGVRFITVHAEEGQALLQTASEVRQHGLEILAVTVLTSRDPKDPFGLDLTASANAAIVQSLLGPLEKHARGASALAGLVAYRALQARDAGCSGIVCSGKEVALVRSICGEKLKIVVPGVRPAWAEVGQDDQSRTITPAEAIRAGADYLVVGRPIRDARDPKAAAQKILDELLA
jgi:orotidine-5'-phosphate decarboxylase